jgi:hypothetical protein
MISDDRSKSEWLNSTDTNSQATGAAADVEEETSIPDSDDDSFYESDYNSIDAARDAQDHDDRWNTQGSYDWSHFFRAYIDRSWVDAQKRFRREVGHDKRHYTGTQLETKLIQFQLAGGIRGGAPMM